MLNRFKTMAATAAAVTALCIGCGDMDRDFYQHTLEISESPIGSGTVSREPNKASYRDGETVTVTATAKSGYSFVSWTGALNATTPSVTFTINSDLRLTANFERQGVTPPDTTRPPEVNGVVGDWLLVRSVQEEKDYIDWLSGDHSDYRFLYSFSPVESNSGWTIVNINRYIDNGREFWIEGKLGPLTYGINLYWRTSGENLQMIMDGIDDYDLSERHSEEEYTYSVSGDTLYLIGHTDDGFIYHRMTFIKVNLETFKRSLGQVYSQDLALLTSNSSWIRPSESGNGYDHIGFFYDGGSFDVYLSGDGDDNTPWYTEGSSLILVDYKWRSEPKSIIQIVTLDYQLTDGTLRLRPAGSSEWDVWTPRPPNFWESKSKASQEKSKRAVSPFQALRR